MSGGADSSMLCYLLCKYKTEVRPEIKLFPVTAVHKKKPYQFLHARKVIEFCEKEFSLKFEDHTTSDAVDGTEVLQQEQTRLLSSLYDRSIIDCHFSGVTSNPPIEVSKGFASLRPELTLTWPAERDPSDRPKDVKVGSARPWFRPFANTDKQGIAELYRMFNLTDTLFPLTKSCEFPNNDSAAPHCGDKCWFCHERQWGFGRLI